MTWIAKTWIRGEFRILQDLKVYLIYTQQDQEVPLPIKGIQWNKKCIYFLSSNSSFTLFSHKFCFHFVPDD